VRRASGALSTARESGYTSTVKTTVPASPTDQLEVDQDIISRVLAGNRDAFSVLINRYSDPLYRHALGMTGSPDVAEDILQMSFIKAYQHLAEVRGRFDAWVFRIVANGCKDWLKNIRRTHLSYDEDDQPSGYSTPDDNRLWRALALPFERQRTYWGATDVAATPVRRQARQRLQQ
jgi:RNA polymerase sigma factor (sigma-70 family)